MKKKLIKKLTDVSFKKDQLYAQKVKEIARVLKREDLKFYIKNLKIRDAKRTVSITVPSEEGLGEMRKYFIKLYPNKKIIFNIDSSLLTGVKVVDYDNVYELSLKGFLEGAIRSTND